MKEETDLLLAIINLWWKDVDTGAQISLMDFQVSLRDVLENPLS